MSVEQHINSKFLVRRGKTPTEALTLLQQVYGDSTMTRTHLLEWHRRFKDGRQEVEEDHRKRGHPQAEQTKILSVRDNSCRAIAVLLLER